jgi:hypothetical protein
MNESLKGLRFIFLLAFYFFFVLFLVISKSVFLYFTFLFLFGLINYLWLFFLIFTEPIKKREESMKTLMMSLLISTFFSLSLFSPLPHRGPFQWFHS